MPHCAWSLAQTGSGADLAAADAKAAAQELAGKLAMHVVAMRPPYLSRETGGRRLTSKVTFHHVRDTSEQQQVNSVQCSRPKAYTVAALLASCAYVKRWQHKCVAQHVLQWTKRMASVNWHSLHNRVTLDDTRHGLAFRLHVNMSARPRPHGRRLCLKPTYQSSYGARAEDPSLCTLQCRTQCEQPRA